jgi:mono/diheme cytochrome c family protein
MKRLLLAMASVGALGGCAGAPIERDRLHDEPGALLFNGYANPAANCYHCHGGDGSGAFLHGPNLAKGVPDMTAEQIRQLIYEGKGHMPAFKDKLSNSEIETLASWLKKTFPPETAPKS